METTNTYQVMPPLSEEEYQALKEDIAENGVLVPVVKDTDGNIIDGHHRVRAYEELLAEGRAAGGYPVVERSGMTNQEKRDLAWRLNMQRRHLNRDQKRDAIAARLKESPEWADNRIAHLLGVDSKTVRGVRTSLEIRKELPKVELLEGKDGKYYPRNRTRDLEVELAQTKTDAVRQELVDRRHFLAHTSEERKNDKVKEIANKWSVSEEHVEDQLNDIVERGPRLKDFGEEKMNEVFVEAGIEAFGTSGQISARAVREKMRGLADLVTGYEGKNSEADPEAVAEAVVAWYIDFIWSSKRKRFDENERSMVRTDVRRYKLLSEWIERFVPLLDAKLEKRLEVERRVSDLRHDLQEDEGINPPP